MAKIDKLTAMMDQRGIQCAMLIADKPSRIFVAGQESAGPVLEAARLTEIVTEVLPANCRTQWGLRTAFQFIYESEQGVFEIGIRFLSEALQVTIARHVPQDARPPQRRSLAAPSELREGEAVQPVHMLRPDLEKPRMSSTSQIVGLSLLATLVGFALIILVMWSATRHFSASQLTVIRMFALLWGAPALAWGIGCMKVAAKRAELKSLLPPGYYLTPAEKLQKALAKVPDFEITQQFIEPDRHSAIAIDENAQKICFLTIPTVTYHKAYLEAARDVAHKYRSEHGVKYVSAEKVHGKTSSNFLGYDPETDTRRGVYPFRAVLESRLLEDGNTLLKTARTSPVGSAQFDSLMTSKAGFIIDQSMKDAGSQPEFKSIDLRIITNDQVEPVHMLHFLHAPAGDQDSAYRTAMRQAEHCHTFMSELINSLDNEDAAAELERQKEIQSEFLKKAAIEGDATLPPSIAAFAKDLDDPVQETAAVVDELRKLTDLRDQTAITQEEFDTLKARLLAN